MCIDDDVRNAPMLLDDDAECAVLPPELLISPTDSPPATPHTSPNTNNYIQSATHTHCIAVHESFPPQPQFAQGSQQDVIHPNSAMIEEDEELGAYLHDPY